MPICEADPWRLQYFARVETAANIPTEDSDAWQWYPRHRWIYDKLAVALSQNLEAGPHGTPPPRFPVFSKPIVNPTGMVGGRIIEAHLRFADQWPDLYGVGWIEAVVGLYEHGIWNFTDEDRRDGYSVVLFGPNGVRYLHPSPALLEEVKQMAGVSSVQITFHEDRAPERHAMPPGGFRLAIVNGFDLAGGLAARERLKEHFLT